ncbi:MAG: family 10 glycosylhydrolase [Ignavibacteriales bacterium]|nr:family 10 glycosylhydrolase [Ignavibacteriales bacterium]
MIKYFLVSFLIFQSILISQPLEEFRAAKLTNVDSNILFSDQGTAAAMDYLASVNVNVVLCVVLNGGYTLFYSNTMDSLFSIPIDPELNNRDALERVIIEAHRNGIEVYPWFEYGFAAWYSGGTPPYGGHILQTKPDWACKISNGQIAVKNGFDWMSAIDPEVQDFMNKLIFEVMTKYDIDGIEFSDRIPAMPIEGGYEPYTVSLYQSEHGGQNPPTNYNDANWKRWRANKMNDWYMGVRTLMKNYDENLFVSSSPSIYPWSYDNYLQDVQTWLDSGVCDQFIPQLYRYTFSEYLYELNQAVNQAGSVNLHKLFGGLLMNIGIPPNEYVMSPAYLMSALQANRDRGVMGEAYFYYEGFKKNNNQLGDTLKATFYSKPAIVPGRNGNIWRPKAIIKNETESGVTITGTWTNYAQPGYDGGIIRTNVTSSYQAVEYNVDVPFGAYFDVYGYLVPNTPWTQNARYVIYSETDSSEVIVNQSNLNKKGWQRIGTVYLSEGNNKVLKIDNTYLESGKYLVADAVMIMINRKLSPEVVVTNVEEEKENNVSQPTEFRLEQNYPNPFNPSTSINYSISSRQFVTLKVYDILGKEVAILVNEEKPAGNYVVEFNATNFTSGVYFYQLKSGSFIQTKKMVLLR